MSPSSARLVCMRIEAERLLSFELQSLDGTAWPAPGAGAHVELQLPGGLVRHYSLLPCTAPDRLLFATQLSDTSEGGSRWLHSQARPGDVLQVLGIRNHFALHEGDAPACLIGAGVGLTPLMAMAAALERRGTPWTLHGCVRSRAQLAFAEQLAAWGPRVRLHIGGTGPRMQLADVMAQQPDGTHFYACGPQRLLDEFEQVGASRPAGHLHLERFSAAPPPPAAGGQALTLHLARSQRRVEVAPTQTLLDALLQAGISVPNSCRVGVCGSCETAVLAGVPEHHDHVLSPQERASNATMMLCCSRASSPTLTLDL